MQGLYCFIVAAICVSSVFAADSNVLVYDDNAFATQLSQHKLAMVAFYAPWCHYSQAMLPEYDSASVWARDNIPEVALIKVDCWTTSGATCSAQNVLGYPTMRIYKNGVYYKDFVGERKEFDILTDLINVWNGAA